MSTSFAKRQKLDANADLLVALNDGVLDMLGDGDGNQTFSEMTNDEQVRD